MGDIFLFFTIMILAVGFSYIPFVILRKFSTFSMLLSVFITKDFGSFHMRMAQQGNKALQSVESNAILGEWIRKKIGAPSGGYITKQMLELYGKTYVTFRKYEDGTYLLDF